jgi:hypothetical protein
VGGRFCWFWRFIAALFLPWSGGAGAFLVSPISSRVVGGFKCRVAWFRFQVLPWKDVPHSLHMQVPSLPSSLRLHVTLARERKRK